MNPFSSKAITVLMMFVIIFNQFQPAVALQERAQPAAAPSKAPGKTAPRAPRAESGSKPAGIKPDKPSLKLTADPKFVTEDGLVTINWTIKGDLPQRTALTLQITFPAGYTPTVDAYDAATQTLSLPVAATNGSFSLNVQNPIDEAVFPAVLLDAQQNTLAETSLSLPKHEKFNVKKKDPSTGSGQASLSARNGKIKVRFGKDALPEDASVSIGAPAGDAVPTHSLSGRPFEIDAQGAQSQQDLHQFAGDVSIDVDYSDMNIPAGQENDLHLYWYDPATDDWAALPTVVDTAAKTLRAVTTHFSVFDTGLSNWQASRLPSLDAFQTSGNTGAASYALPIELPPAPGDLQPNLNLSYNSQTIDQSTSQTQASWVGMGWSLGMNSIDLDDHGTTDLNTDDNSWSHDDTWSITVNGVSSAIVKVGSVYRASDENFMKFEYNANDTWKVWDKTGNTYFFNKKVQRVTSRTGGATTCGHELITYQWFMTKMRNIYGKEFVYTYEDETKDIGYLPQWEDNGSGKGICQPIASETGVITATYPKTITWPNGRYRVRFAREARPDTRAGWVTDAVYHSFQRERLDYIAVEQDASIPADGTFETIIRKYAFEYATNANAPIWPDITWGGGKISALVQVRQFGKGGVGELPTAAFSYGDGMHLTYATNGYGGSVMFEYKPWKYTTRARASQTYKQNFNYSSTCWESNFLPYSVGSSAICDRQGNGGTYLSVHGTVLNTAMLGTHYVRPGGFYKFTFSNLTFSGAVTEMKFALRTGASDPDAGDYVPATRVGSTNTYTGFFEMPLSATKADVMLKASGSSGDARFSNLKVELLTSVYRVAARTISDGNNNSDTYEYDYSGGAVNDSAHSDGACADSALDADPPTCAQYHEKYSEFRGFSSVTETSPGGRQVITNYNQDDLLKGRASQITTKDANNNVVSRQLSAYNTTSLSISPLYTTAYGQALYYNDVIRAWTITASQESRTYANDGSYAATLTEYDYESTYGNQTAKSESERSGSAWLLRRVTHTAYVPNATGDLYLTGLPARQWVTDASGATISQSFNFYDANTAWNAAPTLGKLSFTRAWVGGVDPSTSSGQDCSQVDYAYDAWGNRTGVTTYTGYIPYDSTTAPSGAITAATGFDPTYHTYPLTQANPLNQTTTTTYDYTLGLPIRQTDPNGVETSVVYDNFGRLVKLIKTGDDAKDANGNYINPTLQITYNDTAQPYNIVLRQRIDGNRYYTMRHTYDGLGREILTETGHGSLTSPFAAETVVDHDYTPVVVSPTITLSASAQSAPHAPGVNAQDAGYTQTVSDTLGRPATVTAADGSLTTYSYNGLTSMATDAGGRSTSTAKDIWGNTASITPPAGPGLSYTYDTLGRLLTAARGGATTRLTYDKAGRKLSMSDPDMGNWSYTYNALGNLITQTDARGCLSTLGYDALSRLTTKTSSGSSCGQQVYVQYTYDAGTYGKGRRAGMSSGTSPSDITSSAAWVYDARGRATGETKTINGQPYTTSTTYNSADLPVSMTYPDGETVTTTYNDLMQVDTVSGLAPYITATTYDKAGRMTTRAFGNNTQSQYEYNLWGTQGGRLKTLKSGTTADPTSLQSLEYDYDPVGNINWIKDWKAGPQTQIFEYDPLDRLTHAYTSGSADGAYDEHYFYNPNSGNLETKGGMTLYYDDVNHKHAVSSTSTGNTYGYDANGNQITRVIAGVTYNLAYDAEGRIVEVRKNNASLATFVYDGDGKMVKSVIDSVTTIFVNASYQVKNPTGQAVVTKYYPGGVMRKGGTLYYLLSDHLGSSSITVSDNGSFVSEMRYKAWGEVRYQSGSLPLPTDRTYTGQRSYVDDFGLMYYNARWYDSSLGRFAQADTVIPGGAQGYDRYAYAFNNPVAWSDPSGHDPLCGGSSYALQYAVYCSNFDTSMGITWAGDWSARNEWLVRTAVWDVNRAEGDNFNAVHGGIEFKWDTNDSRLRTDAQNANPACTGNFAGGCAAGGGLTVDAHHIIFASLAFATAPPAGDGNKTPELADVEGRNNVVHELGHAFAARFKADSPYNPYTNLDKKENEKLRTEAGGFASSPLTASLTWRQHPGSATGEVFADMFLGWTYNQWDMSNRYGPKRATFMNDNMKIWIPKLLGQ